MDDHQYRDDGLAAIDHQQIPRHPASRIARSPRSRTPRARWELAIAHVLRAAMQVQQGARHAPLPVSLTQPMASCRTASTATSAGRSTSSNEETIRAHRGGQLSTYDHCSSGGHVPERAVQTHTIVARIRAVACPTSRSMRRHCVLHAGVAMVSGAPAGSNHVSGTHDCECGFVQ